jgi:hypothetical protein
MPWNSYFNPYEDEENPFAPRQQQPVGYQGVDWGFNEPDNPMNASRLNRFDFATPQTFAPQRREQPQAPQYDLGPMQRYRDYLGNEPDKANYKPGKFSTILNSLSAGMESMDKGLGSGVKLYDQLRDRPYEEEYKRWLGRGNKVKADVDVENTRYKNLEGAYNRQVDNARENERLELARKEDIRQDAELRDKGWVTEDGPNGMRVASRIVNGKREEIPTGIKNRYLTADQQQANVDTGNTIDIWKHTTVPEGTRFSAGAADKRQERSIGAAEAAQNRLFTQQRNMFSDAEAGRDWRFGVDQANRGAANRPVDPSSPAANNTAVNIMKNSYPEFNIASSPVRVRGNEIQFDEKLLGADGEPDEVKIIEYIDSISGGDKAKGRALFEKFMRLVEVDAPSLIRNRRD